MTTDKKISCFTILLFWLPSSLCLAQINRNDDVDFAFYLLENRKFEEIIQLFHPVLSELEQNTLRSDSINYILGMAHYYRKELEKSAFHLLKVSDNSIFYDNSIFFSALNYAHLGNYLQAQTVLTASTDEQYEELKAIQLAGIALLKRDFEMFDKYANNFRFEQYFYSNSQSQLLNVRGELEEFSQKTPLMAGTLSAIVPALGKIYTGQLGEGIATFLTVGTFAAITAENWYKNGISNWKTITFGTLFSIFYVGNIFGSVATVKVYINQFNEKQNNTILLSIHLPIRSLFQ